MADIFAPRGLRFLAPARLGLFCVLFTLLQALALRPGLEVPRTPYPSPALSLVASR